MMNPLAAPSIVSTWPSGGPQKLDVPMFALFDQKIDAKSVLAKTKLTANGKGSRLAVREQ